MKSILLKLSKLFSVRMLAIGLTFIQTIVMTRVFGSEVFGLLSIALSVSALLVLILSAGLDQILMRDIARIGKSRIVNSKRWDEIWCLVRLYIIPAVLSVMLFGILLISFTDIFNQYSLPILAAILMLPFVLSRKYLESMCLGTKQVVRSITGSQLIYPLLLIIACGYIWKAGISPSAESVSLSYTFAIIGSLVASSCLILGTLREIKKNKFKNVNESEENSDLLESTDGKVILKSGIHFSLVSLGFVLGQHIDVLLTGVLSTPENVALVRISSRIAELAGLMRAIISMQYKPIIAEAYNGSKVDTLQKHISTMAKIFTFTGIPITIFLFLYAENIMSIFGPEFVEGAWAMRIYVAGVLITLLYGPGDTVLLMSGNEGIISRILICTLIVQVVLNLILIPLFGVLGCATANFISMCYFAHTTRSSTLKKMSIEPSFFLSFLDKKV